MLRNEIKLGNSLAFSLAWGIFWRWMLIGIIPAQAVLWLFAGTLWGQLLQIPLSFLCLWVASMWLLREARLGSLRIIFMEQAHYQQHDLNVTETPQPERETTT